MKAFKPETRLIDFACRVMEMARKKLDTVH